MERERTREDVRSFTSQSMNDGLASDPGFALVGIFIGFFTPARAPAR